VEGATPAGMKDVEGNKTQHGKWDVDNFMSSESMVEGEAATNNQ
jgi:hypothetical protein